MRKSIIAALLFLLILSGCTYPPFVANLLGVQNTVILCEDIVLGVLISDENDPIAHEQQDGYELALQEINAAGGIAGCDLQLKYRIESTDSNPRQTYLAIRSLVEEDEVIAFLGGTSNPASMYAASLANYFEIPFLIPSAGGMHILPEENRWAFRLHASETAYAELVFEMIKQQLGEGIKIAVLFEDSTFGNDAAVAAVNMIDLNNMEVVSYSSFNPAQTSYDILAQQVAESKADLVYFIFSKPEQASNILQSFSNEELEWNHIAVARSGGFATHEFLLSDSDELLAAAENLLLVTRWTGEAGSNGGQFTQRFSEYTEEIHGSPQEPTLYNAEAYKTLKIFAATLDETLQSEPGFQQDMQKLRETLRQSLFNYEENSSIWGNINFSDTGQNQTAISILQFISGELVVVYPPKNAVLEPNLLVEE